MFFRKFRALCFWNSFLIIWLLSSICTPTDRISRGKLLKDGDELISSGRKFTLGFFSPQNSGLRYVGIWYHGIQVQTIVWVANRENPVYGNCGVLTIQNDGNLVILDGQNNVLWSTNISRRLRNATAILNDTGDLTLYGRVRGRQHSLPLWESFNDSTDTFLPEMRAYVHPPDHRVLTSWKSAIDPSPGIYSSSIDPRGSPQIIIWEGSERRWRSGYWNGLIFVGVPGMKAIYLYGFKLINEGDGKVYFVYTASNDSDLVRFQLTWNGTEEQRMWGADSKSWILLLMHPGNDCELYNKCGPFGICDIMKVPMCSCMLGFSPKDLDQWNRGNWSGGCIRRMPLECNNSGVLGSENMNGKRERFYKVDNVKLPDFVDYVGSEEADECERICLQNCSCAAFSFVSGINCMLWRNELIDVQIFAEGGNTLFIRVARSELVQIGGGATSKLKRRFVPIAALVAGLFLLMASVWLIQRRLKKLGTLNSPGTNAKLCDGKQFNSNEYLPDLLQPGDISNGRQQGPGRELEYFSFSCITFATNNFSHINKLGQGGFGHVYKGRLPGGREIAVKRLSRMSGQGLEEFKNEVMLIARLQHRNLVRLLGCCIEGEEKILLYEYMPNKSLDSFLFDPAKQTKLDWRQRLNIIEGVARGLLYLHRDSRLRIIHRDLKASNILLDEDMNPKISDFGMARIFGGNQNEANTNRVVGTYGYMSPEYAMEGLFSVKSDVYSFGVLVLEIVSGRRNTAFRAADYSNIVGYTWDLWEKGKAIELMDPSSIADSRDKNAVLRCIHIGMLCVQDSAAHRPTMSSVVLMLESENVNLPPPRQPTLTSMRRSDDLEMWDVNLDVPVPPSNDVTFSTIVGR